MDVCGVSCTAQEFLCKQLMNHPQPPDLTGVNSNTYGCALSEPVLREHSYSAYL